PMISSRAALWVLLLAAPLEAQSSDRWQPVRDAIEKQLQDVNGAAMSVAVAKDGKIIWEQAFGWANREKMIAATPNTMFSLASISKPITATGLMVQVQRKAIDLDRPTNDYLGAGKITGLAGDASGATVRRVMSHSAGLPLHYQFFYANENRHPPSMDETISRYGILVSAPGETFRYSNLGFGIIDYLISRTSGSSYRDFMRREVFLPLGLTHTSIDIGPGLEAYAAERYDRMGRPVPFYTFDHNGGSAVYSSAHDLVRFGMFHMKDHLRDQHQILSDASIDEMKRPASPIAFGDSTLTYGLGWFNHRSDNGYNLVEHSGGMPGVATVLQMYPNEHLAIVALTNGGGDPQAIAEDIAGVVLPRYADSLKASRARPNARPAPPKFTPGAELVGTWTGTLRTWKKTLPLRLTIEADGDIKVRIGPEPTANQPPPDDTQLESLLNNVTWDRPVLRGEFAGTIPTPDAEWTPHTIALELRLVGDRLRGQANAETPDKPVYFSIASYVELSRRK
ncbi:MAG: serine hydrolase domain-containing protein, partial [Gemmatimonadaceae bacterium]